MLPRQAALSSPPNRRPHRPRASRALGASTHLAGDGVGAEHSPEEEDVGLGLVDGVVLPAPRLLHAKVAPLGLRHELLGEELCHVLGEDDVSAVAGDGKVAATGRGRVLGAIRSRSAHAGSEEPEKSTRGENCPRKPSMYDHCTHLYS